MAIDKPDFTIPRYAANTGPSVGEILMNFSKELAANERQNKLDARQAQEDAWNQKVRAQQEQAWQNAAEDRKTAQKEKQANLDFSRKILEPNQYIAGGVTNAAEQVYGGNYKGLELTPQETQLMQQSGGDLSFVDPTIAAGIQNKLDAQERFGQALISKAPVETEMQKRQRVLGEMPVQTEHMQKLIESIYAQDLATKKGLESSYADAMEKNAKEIADYRLKQAKESGDIKDSKYTNKDGSSKKQYVGSDLQAYLKTLDEDYVDLLPFVRSEQEIAGDMFSKLTTGMNVNGKTVKLSPYQAVELLKTSTVNNEIDQGLVKKNILNVYANTPTYGDSRSQSKDYYNALGDRIKALEAENKNLARKKLGVYADPTGARIDAAADSYRGLLNQYAPKAVEAGGSDSSSNKKNYISDKIEGVPQSLSASEGVTTNSYKDGKGWAIGMGYNLTEQKDNLDKVLPEAGLTAEQIRLAKEDPAKLTITPEQAKKLAQIEYGSQVGDLDRILATDGVRFGDLSPKMQEMATQMKYRGDLVRNGTGYQGDLYKFVKNNDLEGLNKYLAENKDKLDKNIGIRADKVNTLFKADNYKGGMSDSDKDAFWKKWEDGKKTESKKTILENYKNKQKIQDSDVTEYGTTKWGSKPDVDEGRYVNAAGKTDSMFTNNFSNKQISRIGNQLRQDGFNSYDKIQKLIETMPSGKDKSAVEAYRDYKYKNTIKTNSKLEQGAGVVGDAAEAVVSTIAEPIADLRRRIFDNDQYNINKANDISEKIKNGSPITTAEKRFYDGYRTTAEEKKLFSKNGILDRYADVSGKPTQGPITEQQATELLNKELMKAKIAERDREYILEQYRKDPAFGYRNAKVPEHIKDLWRMIEAKRRFDTQNK